MLRHHIFEILYLSIRARWEGWYRCSYCHCLRTQGHGLVFYMSWYLMRLCCTVWKCLDRRTWGYRVERWLLPRWLVVTDTSLFLFWVRHPIYLFCLINSLATGKTRLHIEARGVHWKMMGWIETRNMCRMAVGSSNWSIRHKCLDTWGLRGD